MSSIGIDTGEGTPAARISAVALSAPRPLWWQLLVLAALVLAVGYLVGIIGLFAFGIGILGNNIPAGWGFPIINVAWWIDIGHGALLIAAGLVLLRQHWRGPVQRLAENIALFAGAVGGSFAILHLGRPQYLYFLFAYPNNEDLWPQWRSPLMWDFFGIITFLLYALIFWYVNMVPDLAVLRDRADGRRRRLFYGVLALGWRGSARQWENYRNGTWLLAALAVPMAIGTIGISALDFAGGIEAGYHSALLPVDGIAKALASAFAMILLFAVPLRSVFHLKNLLTDAHLELLGRLLLAAVVLSGLGYLFEAGMAWYSADPFEQAHLRMETVGPFAWFYWTTIGVQVLLPQLLWWRRIRRRPGALFGLSLLLEIGAWLGHYTVIVTSEERGFMTSAWRTATPTLWDALLLAGSIGLFLTLMFLFLRLLPVLSVVDVRRFSGGAR